MTNLYTITFDANGSTGGATPITQTAESNDPTYSFIIPTAEQYGLIKAGHWLVGWSTSSNATMAQYTPGSTITLNKANSSRTLYAVWIAPVDNWNDLYYMQQMSPSACNRGNAAGKQLIDSRDGKSYWIAKLKDGNCWMTQNLALDIDVDTVYTNVFTDLEYAPEKRWDSNSTYKPVNTQNDMTTPSGFSSDTNLVVSYNPGNKYCSNNTTDKCDLTSSTNSGRDAQGNYYSWVAATAGTGGGITSGNASGSICPRGWQLPTSNNTDNKSFGKLMSGISNGTTLIDSGGPYYYTYSGYISGSSLKNVGTSGHYWSSTAYSNKNAYNLYFSSNQLNASEFYDGNNSYRYVGRSVRCVAR